jgi:hypothetical protein
MIRPIFSLVLLLAACAVLAAPAPEPFKSGWGNPEDPDKDCKIRHGGSVLALERAVKHHSKSLRFPDPDSAVGPKTPLPSAPVWRCRVNDRFARSLSVIGCRSGREANRTLLDLTLSCSTSLLETPRGNSPPPGLPAERLS